MNVVILIGTMLLAADSHGARAASKKAADSSIKYDISVEFEPGVKKDAAALAEYNARRAQTPNTADAQWKLALWCEQKGLMPEAMVHAAAVIQLDPRREEAWKKLGFKKHQGRWMTPAQIAAEEAELAAQKKADHMWLPLLAKWKSWLADKSKRSRALDELAHVTEPRAVPAIVRVFGTGNLQDQQRAVRLLGQINAPASSRALARFAVFGGSAEVRSAAIGALSDRDPNDFLDYWIRLLRDPLKYEVRPVAGPGSPGALFVEGQDFRLFRNYAAPSLLQTYMMGAALSSSSPNYLPMFFGNTGTSSRQGILPPNTLVQDAPGHYREQVVIYDSDRMGPGPPSGPPATISFANPNVVPQLPKNLANTPLAGLLRGQNAADYAARFQQMEAAVLQLQLMTQWMIEESQKMAWGSEMQLEMDLALVKSLDSVIRETDRRVGIALAALTGQNLGPDRKAWAKWWNKKRGYADLPAKLREKVEVFEDVPLPYLPVAGPPIIDPRQDSPSDRPRCFISAMLYYTSTGTPGSKDFHLKFVGFGLPTPAYVCFTAGTPVLTIRGTRPIESLVEGELLLSQDPSTGEPSVQPVLALHRSPAAQTLRLTLGDETVITTAGHMFRRPEGRGWVCASDLQPGEFVQTRRGPVRVAKIAAGDIQPVFNLEVDGSHTYLVGRTGALVQDVNPFFSGREPIMLPAHLSQDASQQRNPAP